ncbi:MAG: PAS domain S-box protein [Alphaproteobacteria bacterium]|nr:PAS domain S-box protein [Alphaproteobacteria bacterium]
MTTILNGSYDPMLVLLSMGVATWASFVSLNVASRIWSSTGWTRIGWIVAAATAMGGGIWAMHFIGMLAFSLPVPIGYSVPITLLSLAIAIDVTAVGFAIIAAKRTTPRLALAGTIMGIGVAAMHYTGMAAIHLNAALTYDPTIVGLSVLIACVAATVALWIAMREKGSLWRAGAALIMGAAVYGMHYTGMEAACFTAVPTLLHPQTAQLDRSMLAIVIAIASVVILGLEFLSAKFDRHLESLRAREKYIVQASTDRFRLLVQSSNDIFLVVTRTGQIMLAVQSQGLAGFDSKARQGDSVFDLVEGQGVDLLRRALIVHGPRSTAAHVDHLKIRKADGSLRDYEATLCNMSHEPSIGGVIITFHDVTDRERAVSELLQAKQVSEDASRLKSEFIANMNHELRTPLNAILGFSEIIMNDTQRKLSEGHYRDYAKDINRSGAQLLSIINDILDFAKSDAKQLTLTEDLIDAATLIGDSVRFVTPVANKKGVTLITKVGPNMPQFRGDERRLRQVLLNLLSNAVKFTPAEREVRVLVGLNEAGGVQIDVEDTGIGIPPDQISRVMEPFYQVDGSLARTQEGTGLGLPIAKSLAELHGGTLRLESAVGYGTTARLTLPPARTVRQTVAA